MYGMLIALYGLRWVFAVKEFLRAVCEGLQSFPLVVACVRGPVGRGRASMAAFPRLTLVSALSPLPLSSLLSCSRPNTSLCSLLFLSLDPGPRACLSLADRPLMPHIMQKYANLSWLVGELGLSSQRRLAARDLKSGGKKYDWWLGFPIGWDSIPKPFPIGCWVLTEGICSTLMQVYRSVQRIDRIATLYGICATS